MALQKIENTFFLQTPEHFFTDKNGLPNAYNDMNPSLYIKPDGLIILLIRKINYRKFTDNRFVMGEDKSNSKYVLMTGHHFDDLSSSDIEYDWGSFEKHNTYWEGMEDIRFINEHLMLITVPERNINGNPCIFLANLHLDDSKIRLISKLEPSFMEKNWMPYVHNGNIFVIYSVVPLIVKPLVDNNKFEIDLKSGAIHDLLGYHGSTNGVMYNGSHLFLIHKNNNRTCHRWLSFNPDTNAIQYSDPFIFYKNTYIEFPCSLCYYNNKFYISLGVNDKNALVAVISPDDIVLKDSPALSVAMAKSNNDISLGEMII